MEIRQSPPRGQPDRLVEVGQGVVVPIEPGEDQAAAVVARGESRVEIQGHRAIRRGFLQLPGLVAGDRPDLIDARVAEPAVDRRGAVLASLVDPALMAADLPAEGVGLGLVRVEPDRPRAEGRRLVEPPAPASSWACRKSSLTPSRRPEGSSGSPNRKLLPRW